MKIIEAISEAPITRYEDERNGTVFKISLQLNAATVVSQADTNAAHLGAEEEMVKRYLRRSLVYNIYGEFITRLQKLRHDISLHDRLNPNPNRRPGPSEPEQEVTDLLETLAGYFE